MCNAFSRALALGNVLMLFCGILWAILLHNQEYDLLRPLLFSPVLHMIASAMDSDYELLFQAWYLDDRVIAGRSSDVQHALSLIDELGSNLGIYINLPKCELLMIHPFF